MKKPTLHWWLHRACSSLALAAVLIGISMPATAQTISLQNDATLRITGGGVLDLNGSTLDFGDVDETARLVEDSGGRVTGGLLTATRMLNAPDNDDVAGLGFVITSSATLGVTTVTRGHTVQFGGENASIQRYFDVAPSTNSSLDATLTFHYVDAEIEGFPEGELDLFRSIDGGATWEVRSADSRDLAANTITLSGVDAFSRWTLGAISQPLPVELTTFDATVNGETVQLSWETVSESNNAGFDIERSTGATGSWKKIGFIDGVGTTNEATTYRFSDEVIPFDATRLHYRLRQVDLDGTSSYVADVEVALSIPDRVTLHAPYPNPFAGRTTIRYELPKTEYVRLMIFNALGQRLAVLADETQPAGRKEVAFNAQALPSGVYFVRFQAGKAVHTKKVTVVR